MRSGVLGMVLNKIIIKTMDSTNWQSTIATYNQYNACTNIFFLCVCILKQSFIQMQLKCIKMQQDKVASREKENKNYLSHARQ